MNKRPFQVIDIVIHEKDIVWEEGLIDLTVENEIPINPTLDNLVKAVNGCNDINFDEQIDRIPTDNRYIASLAIKFLDGLNEEVPGRERTTSSTPQIVEGYKKEFFEHFGFKPFQLLNGHWTIYEWAPDGESERRSPLGDFINLNPTSHTEIDLDWKMKEEQAIKQNNLQTPTNKKISKKRRRTIK